MRFLEGEVVEGIKCSRGSGETQGKTRVGTTGFRFRFLSSTNLVGARNANRGKCRHGGRSDEGSKSNRSSSSTRARISNEEGHGRIGGTQLAGHAVHRQGLFLTLPLKEYQIVLSSRKRLLIVVCGRSL